MKQRLTMDQILTVVTCYLWVIWGLCAIVDSFVKLLVPAQPGFIDMSLPAGALLGPVLGSTAILLGLRNAFRALP